MSEWDEMQEAEDILHVPAIKYMKGGWNKQTHAGFCVLRGKLNVTL